MNECLEMMLFLENSKSFGIMDFIQTICSVLGIFLAWLIPEKIKWDDNYANLVSLYQSYDFAIAVQGITEFFAIDCESKVENIKFQYKKRFLSEIYGMKNIDKNKDVELKDVISKLNGDNETCMLQMDADKTLHFQRRLLSQFYWNLDECLKSVFIRKKTVLKDFTKGEANLIRILYLINKAIDEDEILYKDISCEEKVSQKNAKGINKSLARLYSVLKNTKRYIGE